MRLLLTGVGGPLAPLFRARHLDTDELVQLGGEAPVGVARAAGALTDAEAVAAAAEGAQFLVHDALGALAEIPGEEPEALASGLERVVDALVHAARAARARRVVYLSSARCAVLRATRRGPPLEPEDLRLWPRLYALRRAEERVLARCDRVIVLAPAALLGPGLHQSALLSRVHALRSGLVRGAPDVRLCLADARDVLGAIDSALVRGRAGDRYELGGSPFWLRTFDARVPATGGRVPTPPPPDHLPVGVGWEIVDARPAAEALGWWTRRAGRTLRDTLAALQQAGGADG